MRSASDIEWRILVTEVDLPTPENEGVSDIPVTCDVRQVMSGVQGESFRTLPATDTRHSPQTQTQKASGVHMAMSTDSPFTPTLCGRCGVAILTGFTAGLHWRMAGTNVPPTHAAILKHYGVTLLVFDVSATGAIWADIWDPDQHAGRKRYIAAPHVCGAAVNEEKA